MVDGHWIVALCVVMIQLLKFLKFSPVENWIGPLAEGDALAGMASLTLED